MNTSRRSYLVRIWFELEAHTSGFAPALRGSLQEVGSESRHYFHSLAHLTRTLEQLTGWSDGAFRLDDLTRS